MAISRFSNSRLTQALPKYTNFWDQSTVVPDNSYESIATVSVGAGGSSFIEFTSIPSTYKHLQIRVNSRYTGYQNSGAAVYLQFNGDTGSNYSLHRLIGYANLSSNGLSSAASTSQSYLQLAYTTGGSTTTNMFGVQITDIFEYANTNTTKTVQSFAGYDSNTDTGYRSVGLFSGNWRSTNAISSIKIFPETDSWAQYTSFALYGIKG
jgi:hypothetical protein